MKVPVRVQRAVRQKHVKQGLRAGMSMVQSSLHAAQFVRHKFGSIYITDAEGHYLYELGLQPRQVREKADDDRPQPPIITGHRRGR